MYKMKKIIKIFSAVLIFMSYIWLVLAASWTGYVNVRVTEKIPGANCSQVTLDDKVTPLDIEWWKNGATYVYDCKVEKGPSQIIKTLWNIIKYFTYIASLVWVLFIVYNWILYSMWWIDDSMKEWAKKRIIWTLIWLLILFLSWPFLQLIAPWIYK